MKKQTNKDNPDIKKYSKIMKFIRGKAKRKLKNIDINSFKNIVDHYFNLSENNLDEIEAFKEYFKLKQESGKFGIFKTSFYTNKVILGLERYLEEIY